MTILVSECKFQYTIYGNEYHYMHVRNHNLEFKRKITDYLVFFMKHENGEYFWDRNKNIALILHNKVNDDYNVHPKYIYRLKSEEFDYFETIFDFFDRNYDNLFNKLKKRKLNTLGIKTGNKARSILVKKGANSDKYFHVKEKELADPNTNVAILIMIGSKLFIYKDEKLFKARTESGIMFSISDDKEVKDDFLYHKFEKSLKNIKTQW